MFAAPNRRRYRFATFEADPASGELQRKGVRIKLQEQPFRLLVLLLEHPGEVVSREELRSRLWPEDTFVEFDNSLNVAVRKLREALRDDAEAPRFIETLPRRGYRFLADVATEDARDVATMAIDAPSGGGSAIGVRYRRYWFLPALGIGLIAAVVLPIVAKRFSGPILNNSDRVVLADFENTTGDPVFDGTLLPAFRLKLEESPYFNLVSQASLLATVKEQGKATDGPISADVARSVCGALSARAVVYGGISSARDGYLVRVEALRCSDAKKVASEQAHARLQADVVQNLGQATSALRRRLGEPSTTVAQLDTPLAQATTTSLAALKAFSLGEEKRAQGQDIETVSYYKMAADLDPQFALAYGRLGVIYVNAQEFELGKQYYQKAFDLRERTTERERLYLTTHYYSGVTGELDKAIQAYEIWRQLYPNDLVPANNLADLLIVAGEPDKAIEPARDAVRISPRNGFPYMELVQAYMRSGHFAEAKTAYQAAASQKVDGIVIHALRFAIAFEDKDEPEMRRQRDWARGNPREGEMLDAAGTAAFARGRATDARSIFRQAATVDLKNNLTEHAALLTLDEAQYEVELGFVNESKRDVSYALRLAPNANDVQVWAAIVLARAGEVRQADELASRVAKAEPLDTLTSRMELPAERALVDMDRKDPAGALRELEIAKPYDLSRSTALMNIYLRGVAFLDTRRPQEAAGEFQKLLDHRGVQPNSAYVALSQLGLARASATSGDKNAAHHNYEEFFSLWKNADPDVPILKQAKAEYAKLQ